MSSAADASSARVHLRREGRLQVSGSNTKKEKNDMLKANFTSRKCKESKGDAECLQARKPGCSNEKKPCLTCNAGGVVGRRTRRRHVLAAKHWHQLLKELALLLLSSASTVPQPMISHCRDSMKSKRSTTGTSLDGSAYLFPSRNCRKLAFSLLIRFWHWSGVRW